MKKLAFLLLLLPFLISCSSECNTGKKNTELIEEYIQSVEDMDYSMMGEVLADNYFGFGPSHGDSIGKEQAIANWKYNVENLYQSIEYSKSRNIAVTITTGDNQGEWVSNWAEMRIDYKNGESVILWANTLYQIENNKVVKSYTFYNEADALEQLGYVFINPDDL